MTRFSLLQLARQQIVQTGAQRRFDQPRRCHLRAAERNHPLAVQLTFKEKLTNGDRILIIEVPDLLIQAHRLQKVNMRSRQPRRVRPGELVKTDRQLDDRRAYRRWAGRRGLSRRSDASAR